MPCRQAPPAGSGATPTDDPHRLGARPRAQCSHACDRHQGMHATLRDIVDFAPARSWTTTRDAQSPGSRRADSARHRLYDRRDRPVRRLERNVEMAGRDLSGRRGVVLPLGDVAGRRQPRDPALYRLCGVSHPAPARPSHARHIARQFAGVSVDRVQPDAAGERGGDQFLRTAVCDGRGRRSF